MAETRLTDDLARLDAHASDALAVVQRHSATLPSHRDAFNAAQRHAKGLQCAVALLRQQLKYGTGK